MRVMLWSAPRCVGSTHACHPHAADRAESFVLRRTLSTCVERVLTESGEILVHHEPFGVPFYWSDQAPSRREVDQPRRDTSFERVARQVFRGATPAGVKYVLSKDHAYYIAPHCLDRLADFTAGVEVRHSFVIRHPARAITSLYIKSCVDNAGTGYTYFDPVEAGFVAMWDLFCHLQASFPTCTPAIIDADDLLEDPQGIMAAYCGALGLPFDRSMLHWGDKPVPAQLVSSSWTGATSPPPPPPCPSP